MLRQLEIYLAQVHIDRFYIETRALQALLYAQKGGRAKALEALGARLALGVVSPEEVVSPFSVRVVFLVTGHAPLLLRERLPAYEFLHGVRLMMVTG